MYRLREMDVDDKVCEQVSMTMLGAVYPKEVIERCVQQSQPWSSKTRRVRASTALALVLFVIGMALWSRLNQCQVWQSLVGKLSDLHPGEPEDGLSDSGISGRRQALGSQCVQALMRERCQVIAKQSSMPSAFFGRYRLMAIDGTVLNTPDTPANAAAFGRSSNQYGPGAYPQVRCVLLAECGSHLKRQLKHLNKRKEKRDRRPRPRASESGGDDGVRARDAGDAHGRVGETRGAALGGALDCTSL